MRRGGETGCRGREDGVGYGQEGESTCGNGEDPPFKTVKERSLKKKGEFRERNLQEGGVCCYIQHCYGAVYKRTGYKDRGKALTEKLV